MAGRQDDVTKSGFAALIGAPNAGKSTLMNAMVGSKVSIVTPKVQTTRSRIRGIAMEGPAQIVFIDTPGIFQPKRRLDRAMVQAAWKGRRMVMCCCWCMTARAAKSTRTPLPLSRSWPKAGARHRGLNKIDLAPGTAAGARCRNGEAV